jgi:hypothetical protein
MSSRNLYIALLFFALVAVSQTVLAEPQPPKNIDINVVEPQVFRYRYKAKSLEHFDLVVSQKVDVAGPTNTAMSSTIRSGLVRATISVRPDGGAKVRTLFDKPRFVISQNGVSISSSSTVQMEDVLAKVVKTRQLSALGEVRDVEIEGIGAAGLQISESLQSAMIGVWPVFPKKGLKSGDSWNLKVPLELVQGGLNLKINFDITHTFLGYVQVDGSQLAVFRTNVTTALDEKPSRVGEAEFSISGGGKGVGYVLFDNRRGVVVESELELVQRSEMRVVSEGAATQKYSTTQRAETSLKVRK